MVRYVLLMLLFVLAVRVLRRVAGGVLPGAAGRPRWSHPPQHGVRMVRDPVCGTYVIPEHALSLTDGGTPLFFCSASCRDKYHIHTA